MHSLGQGSPGGTGFGLLEEAPGAEGYNALPHTFRGPVVQVVRYSAEGGPGAALFHLSEPGGR